MTSLTISIKSDFPSGSAIFLNIYPNPEVNSARTFYPTGDTNYSLNYVISDNTISYTVFAICQIGDTFGFLQIVRTPISAVNIQITYTNTIYDTKSINSIMNDSSQTGYYYTNSYIFNPNITINTNCTSTTETPKYSLKLGSNPCIYYDLSPIISEINYSKINFVNKYGSDLILYILPFINSTVYPGYNITIPSGNTSSIFFQKNFQMEIVYYDGINYGLFSIINVPSNDIFNVNLLNIKATDTSTVVLTSDTNLNYLSNNINSFVNIPPCSNGYISVGTPLNYICVNNSGIKNSLGTVETSNNTKTIVIIVSVIIVLLVIIFIVVAIVKHNKSNKKKSIEKDEDIESI